MSNHNDGPLIATKNRFQSLNSGIDNFPLLSEHNKKRQRVGECSKVYSEFSNSGRFLLVSHKDENLNLNSLSPFFIQKGLDAHTKNLKNVTRFRNGTLLVETTNKIQTEILRKAESLGAPGSTVSQTTHFLIFLRVQFILMICLIFQNKKLEKS